MMIFGIIDVTYNALLSVFIYPDEAQASRAFDAAVKGGKYPCQLVKFGRIDGYNVVGDGDGVASDVLTFSDDVSEKRMITGHTIKTFYPEVDGNA